MRRARIEHAHLAVADVDHAELVAMICKRDDVAGRRTREIGNSADVAAGDEFRFARRVVRSHGDLLVAVDVRYADEAFSIAKPLGKPRARAAPSRGE